MITYLDPTHQADILTPTSNNNLNNLIIDKCEWSLRK